MEKSRFKGLVEARMQESEETEKPIKKQTKKQVTKKASKLATKQTRKAKSDEPKMLGIGIQVDHELRRFWSGQAKMEGTSLAGEIRNFLIKRFGVPKGFKLK